MKKNKIKVLILIISLSCFSVAYGATLDVSTPAQIQQAFDDAAHNGEDDIINIAAGHYDLDETLTYIQGEQYSITIQGAGMDQTILDGGGSIRVMSVDTTQADLDMWTTVNIKGLSFRNGYILGGHGGGFEVKTTRADVIIENSSFISNESIPPAPNWPDWGDGGGGGLFVTTGINEHGVFQSAADVHIESCLFKNNQSANGAGAYIYCNSYYRMVLDIINNVFDSNVSSNNGAGLWVGVSIILSITNNTIINNSTEDGGGGIFVHNGYRISIYNNIVWGNNSEGPGEDLYLNDGGFQEYINIYNNTFGDVFFSEGEGYSEVDTSNDDPILDASYHLDEQSKCINSGDNDAPDLPTTDYKGNNRISGSTVDRGAIEYGSSPASDPDPEPDPGPDNSSGTGGGSGCFIGTMISIMDYEAKIDPTSEAYKAAKRIAELQKSAKVQSEVERQKSRLKPLVSKQRVKIYQKSCSEINPEIKTGENELLIFVSGSMPPGLTKKFVNESNKLECDVKFILNGQPQKGIGEFVNSVKGKHQKLNLHVDPLQFDAYDVQDVPAMVLNRATIVKHPESIKSALLMVQKSTGQDLSNLIRPITY